MRNAEGKAARQSRIPNVEFRDRPVVILLERAELIIWVLKAAFKTQWKKINLFFVILVDKGRPLTLGIPGTP